MSKQLKIEYNDKEYTLEFNRATVKELEKSGFDSTKFESMPMNSILDLFYGAFLMHHRFEIKRKDTNKIYDMMGNKAVLIRCLTDMYNEPLASLIDEPKEKGNVTWTPNWDTKETDE